MLPKEAIEEFKRIYEEKFKEKLSDEEISHQAIKLLNLYKAVYGFSSCAGKEVKKKPNNKMIINQNEKDVENNR